MNAAYLDASALVKLFKAEPETEALGEALPGWSAHISSELVVVEAICVARRLGGAAPERAEQVIDGLGLAPFTPEIRGAACATFRPPLRALDAIHLASALALGTDVDAFIAYDTELCEAARAQGLSVVSPV